MASTYQDLEDIKGQCIAGFRKYCEQEMQNAIVAQKMKSQRANELAAIMRNAENEQMTSEKWKRLKEESEKLSETSMLAYESFTSMLCKIGSLCVDLNLAIYNERPLSASLCLAREAFCKATGMDEKALIQYWSTRTEPTAREMQTIQNKLNVQDNDINAGRVNLPEITYSITYDTNKDPSLKIDLHVPDNLPMVPNHKEQIKEKLQSIFLRHLGGQYRMRNGKIQTVPGLVGGAFNDITNDDFNALRYNVGQDQFAMYLDRELNNVAGLKLRTIDSAPLAILRPRI